jgi:hypothetical protein
MSKKNNGGVNTAGPAYLDGLFEPEYVQVSGKVEKGLATMVQGYADFVLETMGRKPNSDRVFQAIIQGGIERDSNFLKWWNRQSQSAAKTKPAASAPSSGDAPFPDEKEANALLGNIGTAK